MGKNNKLQTIRFLVYGLILILYNIKRGACPKNTFIVKGNACKCFYIEYINNILLAINFAIINFVLRFKNTLEELRYKRTCPYKSVMKQTLIVSLQGR